MVQEFTGSKGCKTPFNPKPFLTFKRYYAEIAQLVEQLICNQ